MCVEIIYHRMLLTFALRPHLRHSACMVTSEALAVKLLRVPQREHAGASTASRYEFQAFWALALLFEQHALTDDYAIVFEFHDDVALLDSATEPTSVKFYQVKTKGSAGAWTLTKLLEREKNRSTQTARLSIIDKMYDHVAKFGSHVKAVYLVSNQPCNLLISKDKFGFSECSSDNIEKIISHIRENYPAVLPMEINIFNFYMTDLSLQDTRTHIKGKLHNFCVENLGAISFNLEAVYKAIVDECRRKASCPHNFSSFHDVVRQKGLVRSDIEGWVNAIAENARAPDWVKLAPLVPEYPFLEARRIGEQYEVVRSALLNAGDGALHRIRTVARTIIMNLDQTLPFTLHQLVEYVFDQCKDVARKYLTPYNPDTMKAIIIYELHAKNSA